MSHLMPIWTWIRHEWRLELRQKAGIQGAVLYVLVSLVVAYQATGGVQEAEIWVGLLWIVLLFSVVNSSSRSFVNDSPGRKILLYFWLKPGQLILARMGYQMVFNLVSGCLGFLVFCLLMGFPGNQVFLMLILVAVGSAAASALGTFMAAVASVSGNGPGLSAILGLPLMVPTLMAAVKGSLFALQGGTSQAWMYAGMLLLLNLLAVALGYLLFPYLWRD
ncbi:MAG: heme exporter protein CcmB [Bacteroidetes bacterium]|nr:heme exporter protein CcmB [Bacteroidota bacterium]